jgi:hypothetical protein
MTVPPAKSMPKFMPLNTKSATAMSDSTAEKG